LAKALVLCLQFAFEEQSDGVFRSAYLAKDVGLNSPAQQSLSGSASHAVTEDGRTVTEGFHDCAVAARAMSLALFTVAFSSGVGSETIAPHFLADDLSILDVENQKVRTSAEVRRYIRSIR